jgi:hypothetical protein
MNESSSTVGMKFYRVFECSCGKIESELSDEEGANYSAPSPLSPQQLRKAIDEGKVKGQYFRICKNCVFKEA